MSNIVYRPRRHPYDIERFYIYEGSLDDCLEAIRFLSSVCETDESEYVIDVVDFAKRNDDGSYCIVGELSFLQADFVAKTTRLTTLDLP